MAGTERQGQKGRNKRQEKKAETKVSDKNA